MLLDNVINVKNLRNNPDIVETGERKAADLITDISTQDHRIEEEIDVILKGLMLRRDRKMSSKITAKLSRQPRGSCPKCTAKSTLEQPLKPALTCP